MHQSVLNYLTSYRPVDDWQDIFPMKKKYTQVMDRYFSGFVCSEIMGAYIRKSHPGILSHKQADSLIKGKVSSSVRRAITLTLIDKGYLLTRNISFERDVWFGTDEEQFLLGDDDNGLLQSKLLTFQEWKQITAEIQKDQWKEANWPKRRRLILNTIRHEMGYYDSYIEGVGIEEACRLFISYICNYYPELKSGLGDFAYKKESTGVMIVNELKPVIPGPVTEDQVDYMWTRIQEREKVRQSELQRSSHGNKN